MSRSLLALLVVSSLAALDPVVGTSSVRGFVNEPAPDQCCSQKSPVCLCGSCYDRDKAAVIRCRPPPNWDGDCCPDNENPSPPPTPDAADDCCPDGEFCCGDACLADGTQTFAPCGPSKCCNAVVKDKCCSEDAPTCACGYCSADPESPKFCKPGAGWDGDCCPDEPEVKPCEQKPFVVGTCKAAFPRWSFNPDSGKCEQFIYGGCNGNANNFETEKDCATTCGVEAPTVVEECCTPEAPACVCATLDSPGRCVTAETAAMIKCPEVLGATCCQPEPKPAPVDKCCSAEAPVCACGNRCVTSEAASTLRCVATHPEDTCCDSDNLPDKKKKKKNKGKKRSRGIV